MSRKKIWKVRKCHWRRTAPYQWKQRFQKTRIINTVLITLSTLRILWIKRRTDRMNSLTRKGNF